MVFTLVYCRSVLSKYKGAYARHVVGPHTATLIEIFFLFNLSPHYHIYVVKYLSLLEMISLNLWLENAACLSSLMGLF